jgi:hypothetical protein
MEIMNQDPLNFDDELEFRIFNRDINNEDLIDLYKDGYLSMKDLLQGLEYYYGLQR